MQFPVNEVTLVVFCTVSKIITSQRLQKSLTSQSTPHHYYHHHHHHHHHHQILFIVIGDCLGYEMVKTACCYVYLSLHWQCKGKKRLIPHGVTCEFMHGTYSDNYPQRPGLSFCC